MSTYEKLTRQVLVSGIDEWHLRGIARGALARELFRLHALSLGLAAELAGVDRAQFAAELDGHRIPLIDVDEEDMEREFKTVEAMMGKGGRS